MFDNKFNSIYNNGMDEKRVPKDRFIQNINAVWLLAAAAVTLVVLMYINWLAARNGLGLRQLLLSALSCLGFCAVIVRAAPVIERYWGLEPAIFAKYHRYRVYFGIIAYLCVGVTVFCAAALSRNDGGLGDALFRFFGGWWSDERGYFFPGRGDIRHYINIAHFGYVNVESDLRLNIVFYPLFPWMMRIVRFFVRNYVVAGMLINVPLTFASGVMLYGLVQRRFGHDEAARAVKYLLLFPFAFFLFTPMTEALFLFLTVACFYFMKKRSYIIMYLAVFGAGLTRSLGILLVVPIIIESGRVMFHEKDVKSAIRLGCGVFAALAAFAVYLMINFRVYGDPFMFLTIQREHWHQQIDFFWNTAVYLPNAALTYWRNGQFGLFMGFAGSGVAAMALVMSLIVYGAKRLEPTYTAYAAAYFVMAFGATWLLSAPRYSLVIFPIAMSMAYFTRRVWADRLMTGLYGTGLFVYLYYYIDGSWGIY
jgi:hypothetical protein